MKPKKADKDIQNLIREIQRPIKIASQKYGDLILRPLAAKDNKFIHNIIKADLPARDFAVRILRQTLRNPRLGEREIKKFPDEHLERIATKWINDKRMSCHIKDLPEGRISFDLFKQKIIDYIFQMDQQIMATMAQHWPWINDFRNNWMDDIQKAEDILEICGYGHTVNMLENKGFRIFSKINPMQCRARVTNIWLNATRQDWFRDELKERFQNSQMLRHRWIIIEKALVAHRHRDYLLSVPILFTQIEGILGDALVLNHFARGKQGKLYEMDSNGRIILIDGDEKEIRGLSGIIDHPYFTGNNRLEDAIKTLREGGLVVERNTILHGRKTSYGTAKLSTQLLTLIYVLIRDAAEFEPPILITDST